MTTIATGVTIEAMAVVATGWRTFVAGTFAVSANSLTNGTVRQIALYDRGNAAPWSAILSIAATVGTIRSMTALDGNIYISTGTKLYRSSASPYSLVDVTPSNISTIGTIISITFSVNELIALTDRGTIWHNTGISLSTTSVLMQTTYNTVTDPIKIISAGGTDIAILTKTSIMIGTYSNASTRVMALTTYTKTSIYYEIECVQSGYAIADNTSLYIISNTGVTQSTVSITDIKIAATSGIVLIYYKNSIYRVDQNRLTEYLPIIVAADVQKTEAVNAQRIAGIATDALTPYTQSNLDAAVNAQRIAGIATDELTPYTQSNLDAAVNAQKVLTPYSQTDLNAVQTQLDTVITDEYTRLDTKQKSIDNAIYGQERVAGLNESYTQKIAQYRNLIILGVVSITLCMGLHYLSQYTPISAGILNMIYIFIVAISLILAIRIFLLIQSRDNMDFNLLKLPPPTIDASKNSIAGTANYTNLTGFSSCIGAACCGPDPDDSTKITYWDSANSMCSNTDPNAVPFTTLEQAYSNNEISKRVILAQTYSNTIKPFEPSAGHSPV